MLGEFGQRKTLFFYFLVFLKLYTWCCSRCYFALRQKTPILLQDVIFENEDFLEPEFSFLLEPPSHFLLVSSSCGPSVLSRSHYRRYFAPRPFFGGGDIGFHAIITPHPKSTKIYYSLEVFKNWPATVNLTFISAVRCYENTGMRSLGASRVEFLLGISHRCVFAHARWEPAARSLLSLCEDKQVTQVHGCARRKTNRWQKYICWPLDVFNQWRLSQTIIRTWQ